MASLETSSNTSTGVSSGVLDVFVRVVLGVTDDGIQSRLYKAPGTGIKWLLLGPNDLFQVGVFVQLITELCPREGMQLLNTNNGSIIDFVSFTMF